MDHAEARELLELAAVEPGGLDRLMAGDTPDAAALAGHLAGCPDCAATLARLRRDAAVIASVVRSTPSPALRDRTLDYVRQIGRDRSPSPSVPALADVAEARRGEPRSRGRRAALLAGLAAALIAAVAGTGLILDARNQSLIAQQAEIVAGLSKVTSSTLRLEAQPDVRRVELAGGPGSTANGSILFSPASRELVVVASGLTEPAAGQELRCWVEVDGRRDPVGRMYFGGELSFWVGDVDRLGGIGSGARFGVSLVNADGTPVEGDPVLSGELRGS
jgi:anti-sigma-K factor RskA